MNIKLAYSLATFFSKIVDNPYAAINCLIEIMSLIANQFKIARSFCECHLRNDQMLNGPSERMQRTLFQFDVFTLRDIQCMCVVDRERARSDPRAAGGYIKFACERGSVI